MPRAKRTSTSESQPTRRRSAASAVAAAVAAPAAVNQAEAYGVRVAPAQVTAGQNYWRVVSVRHLTPDENRGVTTQAVGAA